jgi:hypothetical protein
MQMLFKNIPPEIAAEIHAYRVRNQLPTLDAALEGMVKEYIELKKKVQ